MKKYSLQKFYLSFIASLYLHECDGCVKVNILKKLIKFEFSLPDVME